MKAVVWIEYDKERPELDGQSPDVDDTPKEKDNEVK